MLLERLYSKEYITVFFDAFISETKHDPELKNEILQGEEIIYHQLKTEYDIKESDLREVIHFGTIAWNFEDNIKYMELDFCERCGYCCKQTSPIGLLPDESIIYKKDPDFRNNIICDLEGYKLKHEMPCKYYDKKNQKCKIYHKRPEMCRNYPPLGVITPECNNSIEIRKIKIKDLIKECLEHNN